MSSDYRTIRSDRQWSSLTRLTQKQFEKLVPLFGQAYKNRYACSIQDRHANSYHTPTFATYEELLFFGLVALKTGMTYDNLSFFFNLTRSAAFNNLRTVVEVLEELLEEKGHMPLRSVDSLEELQQLLAAHPKLLVDVSEQRIERPGDEYEQQTDYSGKKKHIQ